MRRSLISVLLLAALVPALAACGTDDSSRSAGSPVLKDPTATDRGEGAGEREGELPRDDLAGGGAGPAGSSGSGSGSQQDEADAGEDSKAGAGGGGATGTRGHGARSERKSSSSGGAGRDGRRNPSARVVREIGRARATVRALVDGLRAGDEGACTRLMTQAYIERITGLRGRRALARCRNDVSRQRVPASLTMFGPASIKGHRAVVHAEIDVRGHRERHAYELRRQAGRWRVDGRRPLG